MNKYLAILYRNSPCFLCGNNSRDVLCQGCRGDLPYNDQACPLCALPGMGHMRCGRCLREPPCINRTLVLYNYQYPVDVLIRELKFRNRPDFASVLGHDLAIKIRAEMEERPDVLIPVPMHRYRLLQRGYNQSLELARALGRCLDVPVDSRYCVRKRNAPAQTGLSAGQRKANVRGIYGLSDGRNYRHVLIVDDVITTGATVNAIASLFARKTTRVSVCALARAFPETLQGI